MKSEVAHPQTPREVSGALQGLPRGRRHELELVEPRARGGPRGGHGGLDRLRGGVRPAVRAPGDALMRGPHARSHGDPQGDGEDHGGEPVLQERRAAIPAPGVRAGPECNCSDGEEDPGVCLADHAATALRASMQSQLRSNEVIRLGSVNSKMR